MAQKPLKTLIYTLTILLFCLNSSMAEEKYTANECFEKFSRGTLKFNMALDRVKPQMRVQLIKLLGKNKQSFMKALGAIKRSMA